MTPKALTGSAAQSYFRALFAAEPGLAPEIAARLARACVREIAQVKVRRPLTVRPRAGGRPPAAPTPPAFDPFAFSLVAVLKKEGRDALLARLARISAPEQLMALAGAQHVPVTAAAATLEELRRAIIAGAERRLADRRAAAS